MHPNAKHTVLCRRRRFWEHQASQVIPTHDGHRSVNSKCSSIAAAALQHTSHHVPAALPKGAGAVRQARGLRRAGASKHWNSLGSIDQTACLDKWMRCRPCLFRVTCIHAYHPPPPTRVYRSASPRRRSSRSSTRRSRPGGWSRPSSRSSRPRPAPWCVHNTYMYCLVCDFVRHATHEPTDRNPTYARRGCGTCS